MTRDLYTLTPTDIAKRLRIKPSKAKRLMESGAIESFNVLLPEDKYDCFRTTEENFTKYIEQSKVTPKPKKPKVFRRRDEQSYKDFFELGN